MRNVAFAIWMVGFPISNSYSAYVGEYLLGHRYSDEVHAVAAFLCLVIWVAVGMALYERNLPRVGHTAGRRDDGA